MQKPEDGLVTYFSGWHITQDLAHFLAMKGYDAQRVVCYKAIKKTELSPLTQAMLQRNEIDCIVLMSSRTANQFCQLCSAYSLNKSLKSITAITMSKQITSIIDHLKWEDIRTATHPSAQSLMSILPNIKRDLSLSKIRKIKFQRNKERLL